MGGVGTPRLAARRWPLAAAIHVGTLAACNPPGDYRDPLLGEQRALVLLVEWSDRPATLSQDAIDEAVFGSEGLVAYFEENSQGALRIDGEVLDWRRVAQAWADISPTPDAIERVARRAFRDVDPRDFDADGNGRIDHLYILHSGPFPTDRPTPSDLFAAGRADFTTVAQASGFGCVGEAVPTGMIVHELGHRLLRQPDMYGEYTAGDYGAGIWSVMGLGGWGPHNAVATDEIFARPTHFHGSAKATAGWLSETVVEGDGPHQLAPIERGGAVLRLPGEDTDLVLEVRAPVGFSAELPGHGLLVWREVRWSDDPADRPYIRLIQADGRNDLANGTPMKERPLPPNDENFGDAGDPFPGSQDVRTYVNAEVGVELTDIRHIGEDVAFTVRWR